MSRFKGKENGEPPALDPIEDMKINDAEFKKKVENLKKYEERQKSYPLTARPDFEELCKEYEKKMAVEREFKDAKEEFKKAQQLLKQDELSNRKRVLRRLQYCDDSDVITHKVVGYAFKLYP